MISPIDPKNMLSCLITCASFMNITDGETVREFDRTTILK